MTPKYNLLDIVNVKMPPYCDFPVVEGVIYAIYVGNPTWTYVVKIDEEKYLTLGVSRYIVYTAEENISK